MIVPVQLPTGAPVSIAVTCLITSVSRFPSPSGENILLSRETLASGLVVSRTNTGDLIGSVTKPLRYFATTFVEYCPSGAFFPSSVLPSKEID